MSLLQYGFCFIFCYFGREACGILAPQPEFKPTPPALEGEVLTTKPPGKSLHCLFLQPKFIRGSPCASVFTYSSLCLHLPPCLFSYKDTSHTGLVSSSMEIDYTCKDCSQIRSHSQVLEIRTSAYWGGGTIPPRNNRKILSFTI